MLLRYSLGFLLPLAACLFLALACPHWRGTFRDCTCGVRYRDEEVRCCNSETCEEPDLFSRNRTCPFRCQNGGEFDPINRECGCPPGFFGLCCEQETEFCGGILLTPFGGLTSPGYPNHYNNSVKCVWRISTDPLRQIALGNTGEMFEVEQGTTRKSCNHDWVAVFDGTSHSSPLIGRFCGNVMPTVRSSGRHMLVEFSTDWQQRRMGFQLHYVTFFTVESCGRSVFSRQTGIILSPHYPLVYPPDLSCKYTIIVRAGHMVVLSTEELNLPSTHDCSGGDRIIVSRLRPSVQEPLFVLCGTRLFDPIPIKYVPNSNVTLSFTSDCHCSSRPSEGRFKLRFEQIPDFA